MTTRPEFRECAACAAKPGAPVLCDACLHNRAAINRLVAEVAEAIPTKDLYDVCARAFGTTRDVAKERLTTAMYGAKQRALDEPRLIGWTWRAQLDGLHADVRAKRWLGASKTLAMMLRYALDLVEYQERAAR